MNQENLRKTPFSTRDSPQSHRKVEIRCYCDYCITSEQFETDLREEVFFDFGSSPFLGHFWVFPILNVRVSIKNGYRNIKNILNGKQSGYN